MEFRFTAEEEKFRGEVCQFIDTVLPPDWDEGEGEGFNSPEDIARTKAIVKKLAASGWLTMGWPKAYGGMGAPMLHQTIFQEEAAYRALPTDAGVGAVSWVGPVLMMRGSEEQKREHIPPIARGERFWCTLYSEPGAGSDLASLQTRAVRDGDEYVVNGSKIWTSGGHAADWGWLAARTDPTAPKHKGISMFLLNMKTPGITIRPLINIADIHSFNQVFFDNVRVPSTDLLGEENRGWYLATTTLDFERSSIGSAIAQQNVVGDIVLYVKEQGTRNREQGRPSPDNGRGVPMAVRLELAERAIEAETARLLSYRVITMQNKGLVPNHEASAVKLFAAELSQRVATTGLKVAGLYGMLDRDSKAGPEAATNRWTADRGRLMRGYLNAVAATIAGGTSEIQRGIISTRGLGLPRG
ncbi:MAG: acyl-CoA dehydrogenase family protein [Chloroflexi bacterium]|nr:acyl-CoA dehydrogenase family protein [Chloroflexota bacterium]